MGPEFYLVTLKWKHSNGKVKNTPGSAWEVSNSLLKGPKLQQSVLSVQWHL